MAMIGTPSNFSASIENAHFEAIGLIRAEFTVGSFNHRCEITGGTSGEIRLAVSNHSSIDTAEASSRDLALPRSQASRLRVMQRALQLVISHATVALGIIVSLFYEADQCGTLFLVFLGAGHNRLRVECANIIMNRLIGRVSLPCRAPLPLHAAPLCAI